jgi:hypothetical protein
MRDMSFTGEQYKLVLYSVFYQGVDEARGMSEMHILVDKAMYQHECRSLR